MIEHCLRYLNHIIFELGSGSPVLHNLFLSLLVSKRQGGEGYLLKLLAEATSVGEGQPLYDLDFALRLCLLHDLIKPSVLLYAKMGLWEECVDLALAKGEFELATANADMAGDDIALRKRLWLKIATFVVKQRQDIQAYVLYVFASVLESGLC
jgi:vacuolar protein sorting-associated protein 18